MIERKWYIPSQTLIYLDAVFDGESEYAIIFKIGPSVTKLPILQ
jgi:hypothetical protein